jgi:enoyl-CoA hydratase/carnithine racemase
MAKMRTYTEAENLRDAQLLFEMVHAIHACPVPVLARVNGAALGGGVGLVSACDIALSVSSAKFGLTEVKLGLSPAVISSFVMGKMTPSAASYYFLTGQRFDAEEARRVGLVHQVLEDESKLDQAVQKVLEELALNSPKAGQFAEYSTHSLTLSDVAANADSSLSFCVVLCFPCCGFSACDESLDEHHPSRPPCGRISPLRHLLDRATARIAGGTGRTGGIL